MSRNRGEKKFSTERAGNKKFNEYYLGLDIGTDSIGWCVTDPEYRVLKFHDKAMWGIRLFDEASSAAERRAFRTSRRRLHRRQQRIRLIEELFGEEISKIDPDFFLRLKESRFSEEDKDERIKQRFTLFSDTGYKDYDYHKDYPTIYHLRQKLMEGKEKSDIRLYYLAITHFMKHRGHFLFTGSMEQAVSFESVFSELRDYVDEQMEISLEAADLDKTKAVLLDQKASKTDKKRNLNILFQDVLSADRDKAGVVKEILAALCGSTVSLEKLFATDALKDAEVSKISFSDGIDDAKAEILSAELGDGFEFILKLKAVYDWSVLALIMAGSNSISEAQVNVYKKHQRDLRDLKKIIRQYLPTQYKSVFQDGNNEHGYPAYSGHASTGRPLEVKKTDQRQFCDYIRKLLNGVSTDDPMAVRIIHECENYTFMPKQVSKNNSTIPNQVHLKDLEKIVENLGRDYPTYTVKDPDGYSVCEKILKIFSFRIPYYVGPLNAYHSDKGGNSWVVRRESGRVLPWLFEKQVDEKASAEAFIRRLTNKCTYLMGEDVLPKDSLLYSKYLVLNELNNVRVNGNRLEVAIKQRIYDEVFKTHKGKYSLKKLKDWMRKENMMDEEDQLSGIDDVFQASLKSYQDFKKIIGSRVDTMPLMVEELIQNIVIFGDDKRLLFQRINERFGEVLCEAEIRAISKLAYSGWGRFSEKFLNGIEDVSQETGEVQTIISAMWNGQNNLMELLSSKYGFMNEVRLHNEAFGGAAQKLSYDLVKESYASPAVKRGIWQTLQIVDEITKITGAAPARVFLETAREKEKNPSRKLSRKSNLLYLYKNIKSEEKDWIAEIESKEEREFKSKKLFLYYTQMGRDMYTGKEIALDDLFTNAYDIDHIFPQSRTKDDSILNNLVLVRTEANKEKSDTYPVPSKFRQTELWRLLREKELITKEKFERLMRRQPLSDEELASFINRQLVETRQSTKVVAQILGQVMPGSKIVYSKAGLVSAFRKEYEFYKSRAVNDYHHAKDAYLNIVVGNVYYTRFTDNPLRFIKDEVRKDSSKEYNLNKIYQFDVVRNGKTAWQSGENGTIATVRKYMSKNNILFTRYATERRGGFYDQQPLKKGKGQLLPLKTGDDRFDINKLGGYSKPAINYFMLVESDDKKGRKRTLEGVPVYLANAEKEKIEEFCSSEKGLNLKNPKILIPEIKINALLKLNGYPMHISGKTDSRVLAKNAVQLCVSSEDERIIHHIEKAAEQLKENRNYVLDKHDSLQREDLIRIYDLLTDKAKNTIYSERPSSQLSVLQKGRDAFVNLPLEDQCLLVLEGLRLYQCKPFSANLKPIGGSGQAGVFKIANQVSRYHSAVLIHQSITGLFETEESLLSQA